MVSSAPSPPPDPRTRRGRGVDPGSASVCRTDLHIAAATLPLVPGHEAVQDRAAGRRGRRPRPRAEGRHPGRPAAPDLPLGARDPCARISRNGYTRDGGYADYADARYCFPVFRRGSRAAPFGLIGYRSPRATRRALRLRRRRPPSRSAASSAGATSSMGRVVGQRRRSLDAAILYAPVGALVPAALGAVAPGGIVVCAGIHMSDIPSFPYDLLAGAARRSVANQRLPSPRRHPHPPGRPDAPTALCPLAVSVTVVSPPEPPKGRGGTRAAADPKPVTPALGRGPEPQAPLSPGFPGPRPQGRGDSGAADGITSSRGAIRCAVRRRTARASPRAGAGRGRQRLALLFRLAEHAPGTREPRPALRVVGIVLQPGGEPLHHAADHPRPLLRQHLPRRGDVFPRRAGFASGREARDPPAQHGQPISVFRRGRLQRPPARQRPVAVPVLERRQAEIEVRPGLFRIDLQRRRE